MAYLIIRHNIADAPERIIHMMRTGTGNTTGIMEAFEGRRRWTCSDGAGDALVGRAIGTEMGVARGGYAVTRERMTGEGVASEGIPLRCSVEVREV